MFAKRFIRRRAAGTTGSPHRSTRVGARLLGSFTLAVVAAAAVLTYGASAATASAASLSASPSSVAPGSSVTATWSNVATPTTTDWVGLYASSAIADTGYLSWVYTGGAASGSKTLTIPAGAAPGSTYQLRLFANNGYTRLATSGAFTVAGTSLSASPSSVAPGSSVTATWSNIAAPTTVDWVGLYPSSSTPDTGYLSWVYTGGAAGGSKALTIPAGAAPGSTYQLRLFANNGYTRLATSGAFTVSNAASLSASSSSVTAGSSITATWSNIAAPTTVDWVGLYPSSSTPDTGYLSWVYTGGAASGSKALTIPAGAAPGSAYHLRLFANNGYTRLATSAAFTVTAASADCATAEQPYAQYTKKVPVTAQDVVNAEHSVLYLVNVERAKANLPALCWNDKLGGAARGHSENWRGVERSCPTHPSGYYVDCSHWDSRPGLAWPENRIAASGYPAASYGENTQNGGGPSNGTNWVPAGMTWGTPEVAVYWWMNHDNANNGHRAAILNSVFKDAGTGVATYTDSYGNNAAAFTLDFGSTG